jgi:GNAT superfamily N-acetyltransferase
MGSAIGTIDQVRSAGEAQSAFNLRRAVPQDSRRCFDAMWAATLDLAARKGEEFPWSADDVWPALEGLYAHLAAQHAEWWLAEDAATGQVIGSARSIERGGLFQLTELHVRPGEQSKGVGRALIERAFPVGRGDLRLILATNDVRALARYYAANVVAQVPLYFLVGEPAAADTPGPLTPVPLDPGRRSVESILAIDRAGIGLDRSIEAAWLLTNREGYLYRDADGASVGYGFVGPGGIGPIAATEPAYLPEMLLHVEDRAHTMGTSPVEFTVPGPNGSAMCHLLRRGFQLSPLMGYVMANQPFGRFDRYLHFDPPFVL